MEGRTFEDFTSEAAKDFSLHSLSQASALLSILDPPTSNFAISPVPPHTLSHPFFTGNLTCYTDSSTHFIFPTTQSIIFLSSPPPTISQTENAYMRLISSDRKYLLLIIPGIL